jgi:UDP-N-acetylmuramate--alanine ligase
MNKICLPKNAHVHMIGIGGIGVSGLAIVMSGMGYRVSGSDLHPGGMKARLESAGIKVYAGHHARHIAGADAVVATAAVRDDNPELTAAKEKGIPVLSRAQMLGELMNGARGIAVSGTHGKTTTTAMLAVLLEEAALDPTILIGGDLDILDGSNAKLGGGDILLAEACEAFESFLELHPNIAVITNIEADHLDYYGSLERILESFGRFLSQIEPGGCAILDIDSPNVRKVLPGIKSRVVTYGLSPDAVCRAEQVDANRPNPVFSVVFDGSPMGEFSLSVPGMHNVGNALATIAVARELGISPEVTRRALKKFHGAGRRFEVLGTVGGITVIDDYAHHPTEIAATIQGARTWGRRIVAIFQPHLFSRTRLLAREFAESLSLADRIYLADIYPAREKPEPGVSAATIGDLIQSEFYREAVLAGAKEDVADAVLPNLLPGDLVIVMGAGDIRYAAEEILKNLHGE